MLFQVGEYPVWKNWDLTALTPEMDQWQRLQLWRYSVGDE